MNVDEEDRVEFIAPEISDRDSDRWRGVVGGLGKTEEGLSRRMGFASAGGFRVGGSDVDIETAAVERVL